MIRVILLFLVIGILGSCKIVKHQEKEVSDKKVEIYFMDGSFDSVRFVESIWENKVLPTIRSEADPFHDVFQALESNRADAEKRYGLKENSEGFAYHYIVKGTAKVLAVNTKSKAGTIEIDVEPFDGKKDAVLQIGPIIKGNTIRDALEFLKFGDFRNQVEFGTVSKALNKRAYNLILEPINKASLLGKTIEFHATFKPEGARTRLTPVIFKVL